MDFDGLTQEERIRRMRIEIERLGGTCVVDAAMPADIEEEFLKHVLEYELAEPISLFKLLEHAGFQINEPHSLGEKELSELLTALIERMATMGAYLANTNHLSDRELYQYLYDEGLREEAVLFPENPNYAYVIDLTGSGSDEDMRIYLKYFADEVFRRQWAQDWPDDPMPDSEPAPFDRDSRLPKSPLD
jgi:hypothetical protein